MKRYGMVIGLKPEAEQKYKEHHAAVWPAVLEMIHACNIRNYSIYLRDHTLFSYFEYHGTDFAADMARMAADTDHAEVVGPDDAHAKSSTRSRRGRVVGSDGGSLSPRLATSAPHHFAPHPSGALIGLHRAATFPGSATK